MQWPPTVNAVPDVPLCNLSLAELLLHALVMELEATQRYEQLANMMEQTGNHKVAKIFSKMAAIEGMHAAKIDEQIKGRKLPILTPSQYHWRGNEAPENTDSGRLFQLMTPSQAMSLALNNEKRAFQFFEDVVVGISCR